MKNRMLGYLFLMQYRFANLCIKADPLALMSIEVDCSGNALKIEEVANVATKDDYTFMVVPKYSQLLQNIIEGTKIEHPEFKVSVAKRYDVENSDEDAAYFRMPEVNDDRKKEMEDAVDLFGDECKAKLESCHDLFKLRVGEKLVGEEKKDVDARMGEIEETFEKNMSSRQTLIDQKKKEIAEAWEQWRAGQAERDAAAAEASDASGKDSILKMKMGK